MGEVFAGRFELVDPIAEGGMGSVWVVRDLKDDQLYAGKLLRQSDSASLLRFMREQSTRIRHPHVVTPLSWAGEDSRVLFTMPLVRGGSVATLIRDHGRLPGSWVTLLLLQTLDALSAVHAEGIVHRDIKPGNLLLHPTGDGRPYLLLTDFGISARVDDPRLTHASQVIGSPGYMAPEQRSGAHPDPSQDIYAVGLVGLEMLTGTRPTEAVDAARALRDQEPGLAPLVELLLQAASPSVTDRPATALDLRDRLAQLRVEDARRPDSTTPRVSEQIMVPDGTSQGRAQAGPAAGPGSAATQAATRAATRGATRAATQGATRPVTQAQPSPTRPGSAVGVDRQRIYAALLILIGILSLAGAIAVLVV